MAHVEPHGYFWQGDTLLAHSLQGPVAVATTEDFPQLVRLRALRQRENERRYRRQKGAATRA